MKLENLERATELARQIKSLSREIDRWLSAVRISGSIPVKGADGEFCYADSEHVDFGLLQTNTLAKMNAKMNELTDELETL